MAPLLHCLLKQYFDFHSLQWFLYLQTLEILNEPISGDMISLYILVANLTAEEDVISGLSRYTYFPTYKACSKLQVKLAFVMPFFHFHSPIGVSSHHCLSSKVAIVYVMLAEMV